MGSESIIGKSMKLGTKVKKALACFEEDFDIPAFSIDPDVFSESMAVKRIQLEWALRRKR